MIRINLLSDREAVRKEMSRQQGSILLLSLVLLVVILSGVHFRMYQKKKSLENEIVKVNKALTELQAKVGKVEEYKGKKQELETKLSVIEKLEKGKLFVPRMLDSLAETMPEKMWVEKLSMRGSSLSMEGYAIDHETIATFMKNLEGAPFFNNVELNLTEKKKVGGVDMKYFSLVTIVDPSTAVSSAAADPGTWKSLPIKNQPSP